MNGPFENFIIKLLPLIYFSFAVMHTGAWGKHKNYYRYNKYLIILHNICYIFIFLKSFVKVWLGYLK